MSRAVNCRGLAAVARAAELSLKIPPQGRVPRGGTTAAITLSYISCAREPETLARLTAAILGCDGAL